MDIRISQSSGEPIYEQIVSEIKRAILSGTVKKGDALPSMRLLAKELRVSVITTKRAYEELEHQGFIETAVGRGSFVKIEGRASEAAKEEYLRKVDHHLTEAVRAARDGDIAQETVRKQLATIQSELS